MRRFILFVLMAMSLVTMQAQTDNADWQDVSTDNDTIRHDSIHNRDTENTYSPLEQFLPPSPQAAALARYGEYPVSLATGVPEIKIPLYEIKLGNYTLPISISYHASGIKVDDVASTVGLGWVLNAGGAISRTIVGAPDFKSSSLDYDTLYRSYDRFLSVYNSNQYYGIVTPILQDCLNQSAYDIASDRYSYNFGTMAGVFRYSHRDKRFVVLNHHPIWIDHSNYSNDGYFSIIDSDGTTYIFNKKENSWVGENNGHIPTTWYLTEIQTPYGNINFSYQSVEDFETKHWGESLSVGTHYYYDTGAGEQNEIRGINNTSSYFIHHSVVLLKKIEWNGNSMLFNYNNDRSDIAKYRLTSIIVKGCDTQIFKTISLNNNSYLGNSQDNKRMLLSSLSISDEGTYNFGYNTTILPNYSDIGKRDYWGYFNNASSLHIVAREAAIAAYQQFSINNTCFDYPVKSPDLSYAKAGILEGITYPTGGHTTFSYELNLNGTVGGLRVDSIVDTGTDTSPKLRHYSYSGYATQDSPRDALIYTTYHAYGTIFPGILHYSEKATCSSESLIPLCDGSGSTVFYDNVIETDGFGNKIKYHYTNGRILPYNFDYSANPWPQFSSTSLQDEGTCDPLLDRKEYYQGSNILLRKELYEYQENELDSFEIGVKILNTLTGSTINGEPIPITMLDYKNSNVTIPIRQMKGYVKTFSLSSKTITEYKQTAGGQTQPTISTTETYTYDPQFRTLQPKTITKTNSDGKVFRTTNTYTFESNQQPYTTMANYYNMVDQIIETKDYCDNSLIRTQKTTYLYQNDWYYPEYIYESLLNNTQTEKLHLSDYDSHGNPRTVIENGSDKTALVWGFKYSWPVAKVSGLGYSDLTGLGLTSTLNNIAQDSVPSRMANYLTTLRNGIGNNGLVTTYNYKPLYGVSAITAESGYTTYYDYGSNGKLSKIRDSRGPLQQFSYQYAHPYSGSNNTTNFVRTTDMLSSSTGKITCQYYDGLGRPIETAKNIKGKYVYTLQKYDAKGRISEDWLPAPNNTTLSYLSSIASISSSFYSDNHAYSVTTYDALDRPTFIQSPGNAWHNASKGISKQYLSNASNSVKRYQASLSNNNIIMNGIYAANTLYAEKTTDEDNRAVTVFSDKLGRKILERRGTDNDTYFVYDDLGQLRFVMPPEVADYYESNSSQSFSAQSNVMLQYGYEYRYDSRHNCIYKRLPGCDPVYYVYDKAGRCILSQDGVQRNSGKWSFNIPDIYGRTALTGICSMSISYTNEPYKNTVVYAYRSSPSSSILGYLLSGISMNISSVYLANYYDDYSFIGSGLAPTALNYATPPTGGYGTQGLTVPRGLLTGTAVGCINSSGVSSRNYSAIYYDNKERIIQTRSTNHMNGNDYEYTGYTYTDNISKRQHVHSASGMSTQTETYTYEYNNNTGLLERTKHKLNTNSELTLHQNTYNDIGLLTGKTNGNFSGATETYTYNVRSWLKTISAGTLFNETLYYNDTYGGSTPQYGGNLSAITWKADSKTRGYKFTYDVLSRLTKAQYMENGSASSHYNTEYTYDKMGNILTLKRNGKLNDTSYPIIDNLTFTYTGNQVTRIDDSGSTPTYTGAFNFVNGVSQSNEYTYDKNGNLTKDLNKNISSIQYNLLNLPTSITYSSGKSATYIYDATGRKLRTSYKASASATAVPTDYCGNMIYENGVLKQILVDGGYISFSGSAPYYHFYLKDHLGNNCVALSPSGTAEQVNHYYPFGGLLGESTGNTVQRFRYNGKELDRTHGIDWYDYGARHMTPDAGRFTTIDPMAEKYYNISPYAYCANNPVNYIDSDGKRPKAKEAALMAAYAYRDKDAVSYLKLLNDAGWKLSDFKTSIIKNHTEWYQNGLQSELFEKTINGKTEYVYAYAGTNSFEDVLEDIAQLAGVSPQYKTAINNAKTLSNELGHNELTFVGHSLGGGEAAAASMATGRSAITFNPASVSQVTTFSNNLGITSKITNYRTKGINHGRTKYIFGGDPISNIQDNLGIGAPGFTIPIYIDYLSHSISEFLNHDLPER